MGMVSTVSTHTTYYMYWMTDGAKKIKWSLKSKAKAKKTVCSIYIFFFYLNFIKTLSSKNGSSTRYLPVSPFKPLINSKGMRRYISTCSRTSKFIGKSPRGICEGGRRGDPHFKRRRETNLGIMVWFSVNCICTYYTYMYWRTDHTKKKIYTHRRKKTRYHHHLLVILNDEEKQNHGIMVWVWCQLYLHILHTIYIN